MPRAALLALTVMLGYAPLTRCRAELPASAVIEIVQSYRAFEALAKERRSRDAMPRWSEPADQAVLDKLWDTRIFGEPPYQATDVEASLKLWDRATAIGVAYDTFIGGKTADATLSKNGVSYQEEVVRSLAFIVAANAVCLSATGAYVSSDPPDKMTPTRLTAAKSLRESLMKQLLAIVRVIGNGLEPANRALIINALAIHADAITGGLSLRARGELRTALYDANLFAHPPLPVSERKKLVGLYNMLNSKPCTGLCAIP